MAAPNPQHAGVPPPAVFNRIQQVAIPVFANVVGRALAIDPQTIALYAGGLGIAAVLALTAGNNKTFWKVVSGNGDPLPPRWVDFRGDKFLGRQHKDIKEFLQMRRICLPSSAHTPTFPGGLPITLVPRYLGMLEKLHIASKTVLFHLQNILRAVAHLVSQYLSSLRHDFLYFFLATLIILSGCFYRYWYYLFPRRALTLGLTDIIDTDADHTATGAVEPGLYPFAIGDTGAASLRIGTPDEIDPTYPCSGSVDLVTITSTSNNTNMDSPSKYEADPSPLLQDSDDFTAPSNPNALQTSHPNPQPTSANPIAIPNEISQMHHLGRRTVSAPATSTVDVLVIVSPNDAASTTATNIHVDKGKGIIDPSPPVNDTTAGQLDGSDLLPLPIVASLADQVVLVNHATAPAASLALEEVVEAKEILAAASGLQPAVSCTTVANPVVGQDVRSLGTEKRSSKQAFGSLTATSSRAVDINTVGSCSNKGKGRQSAASLPERANDAATRTPLDAIVQKVADTIRPSRWNPSKRLPDPSLSTRVASTSGSQRNGASTPANAVTSGARSASSDSASSRQGGSNVPKRHSYGTDGNVLGSRLPTLVEVPEVPTGRGRRTSAIPRSVANRRSASHG